METELIDALCSGLSSATPIGSTHRSELGLIAVPFLCVDHQFIALYQPVAFDPDDFRSVSDVVMREAGHNVCEHAHMMKFVAAEQYRQGDQSFAPLAATMGTKLRIYREIPGALSNVTNIVLKEVSDLTEIYFTPGGAPKRASRLNSWYARIADKICVDGLGLQKIHQNVGEGWYGYRKVEIYGASATESRKHLQNHEFPQPVLSTGQAAQAV